jgi:hypothetical protein
MDEFIDLVRSYADGLDTAGSYEAIYFEDWYLSLSKKQIGCQEVMRQIERRYKTNNPDVVEEFKLLLGEMK